MLPFVEQNQKDDHHCVKLDCNEVEIRFHDTSITGLGDTVLQSRFEALDHLKMTENSPIPFHRVRNSRPRTDKALNKLLTAISGKSFIIH